MLTYLRHPQLAVWLVILGLLGGLLLFAQHQGGRPGAKVTAQHALGAVPATRSEARAQVAQLQSLAPAGLAAGTDAQAVSAWATAVAKQARDGGATRAAEGADDTDPLRATLLGIADRADALDAARSVPVSVASLRTQILMRIDQAAQVVSGMPTAQLPAGATTPLPSSNPDAPTAPNPDAPTLPTPAGTKTALVPTHSTPTAPDLPVLPK